MKTLLLLCCALLSATELQAQIIRVPADYPTIQEGINAADSGNIVLVSDGMYQEQVNFLGKKWLTVASEFSQDGDSSHIANTIIDGSLITDPDSASVVYFISGEDTTSILCGFTIQHGLGTFNVANGSTHRNGGGVFIAGSGAKLIHNHITENHMTDTYPGFAEHVWGAGVCTHFNMDDHWVVIDHNVIDHNSCTSASLESSGAGMAVCYNARITNNMISDNTCTGTSDCMTGGAGFVCATDVTWTNEVTEDVQDNIINNNLVEAETGYAAGGGVIFQAVKGLFINNEVIGNEVLASTNIGGSGGLHIFGPIEGTVVSHNSFGYNRTSAGAGGLAIEATSNDPQKVLVEKNYFLNNEAIDGGAFMTFDNPVILQNNVFSGNYASVFGGALYILRQSTTTFTHLATLVNNTIYRNMADFGGALVSVDADPLIFNCILLEDTSSWGNEIYVVSGFAEIAYSNITSDDVHLKGNVILGEGRLDQDPQFCFCLPDSLSLDASSPCKNTGTGEYFDGTDYYSAPADDILGIPRPQYTGYDMGAYEFMFPCETVESFKGDGLCITNSPNPFTVTTTFEYGLTELSLTVIRVFNSIGQVVAEPVNAIQMPGGHKVIWDAGNLPAGIYHYRIDAGGMAGSGKMVKY